MCYLVFACPITVELEETHYMLSLTAIPSIEATGLARIIRPVESQTRLAKTDSVRVPDNTGSLDSEESDPEESGLNVAVE